MQKFSAVFSCILTVLIAVLGISVYASGNGYMTWFGIKMSPGVFGGLIAGLGVYDYYAIRKAFGAKKQTEEALANIAQELYPVPALSKDELIKQCGLEGVKAEPDMETMFIYMN